MSVSIEWNVWQQMLAQRHGTIVAEILPMLINRFNTKIPCDLRY